MQAKSEIFSELKNLRAEGIEIFSLWEDLIQKPLELKIRFHRWFQSAERVVKFFEPKVYDEFCSFYGRPDDLENGLGYSLAYFFKFEVMSVKIGSREAHRIEAAKELFSSQIAILAAIIDNIDSILMNLENEIIQEYQEDELKAAERLLEVNIRAAGALCGVVIERHLKQILRKYDLEITKKNPGISDLSQILKQAGILDLVNWKKVEVLGAIRNLCDHDKGEPPTNEQVLELLQGTKWLLKLEL